MAGFGNLILNMLGHHDPRQAAVAALLGGGAGAGAPGQGGTGAGVGTAAGGVAGTPPQASAYQSPPDLLNLYSELTDRQERSKRIDSGLGMLASTIVQPQNREMAYKTLAGDGGGDGGIGGLDPMALVTKISEAQAAAEEKRRQRAALPAIAEHLGIPIEDAQMMMDNGQLDELFMQNQKPDRTTQKLADGTEQVIDQRTGLPIGGPIGPKDAVKPNPTQLIKDDKTGQQFLIDSTNGTKVAVFDTGLAPDKENTMLVQDSATGRQFLINKQTGDTIKTFETALSPTNDQQNFNVARAVPEFDAWLKEQANLKTPKTTVNVDTSGNKLADGFDEQLKALPDASATAAKSMATVAAARAAMDAPGGIISGSAAAPVVLEFRKAMAATFGLKDDAVANTDTFIAEMNNVVLPALKQTGTGNSISDADVRFISKATGADLATNPEAQRRILSIQEHISRDEIIRNNERLQKRINAETNQEAKARLESSIVMQPVPDFSQAYLDQVNPEDVANLKKAYAEKDETFIKQFDKTYGIGMSTYFVGR